MVGMLCAGFVVVGALLLWRDADRVWLHVAASGFFWSLIWTLSCNSKLAALAVAAASLGWELILQPLRRGSFVVDIDQIVADCIGGCLAFAVYALVRRSRLGCKRDQRLESD